MRPSTEGTKVADRASMLIKAALRAAASAPRVLAALRAASRRRPTLADFGAPGSQISHMAKELEDANPGIPDDV